MFRSLATKINGSPRLIHLVALSYLSVVVWVLFLISQKTLTQRWIMDATPLIPQAVAVGLAATLGHRQRNAGFWFLAVGIALIGFGDGVWSWYEGALGRSPSTPGLADLGYGPAYLILAMGLLILAWQRSEHRRRMAFFEGALLCLILSAVVHAYFSATPITSGVGAAEQLINSLYLGGDGLWVFAALVLMGQKGQAWRIDRFYVLLGSAVVLWVLTDILYTHDTLDETYFTGVWYDIGYTLSFTLMALAFYHLLQQSEATAPKQSVQQTEIVRVFMPYGIAALTFLLLGIETWREKAALRSVLEMALLGLCMMVVVRQALLLLENWQLNRELLRAGGELEHIVQLRTLQLERRTQQVLRFNALTKQLTSSLDEDVVWRVVIAEISQILTGVMVAFQGVDELSRSYIKQYQAVTDFPAESIDLPIEGRTTRFAWLLVDRSQVHDEADHAILEEIASAIGMAISNARAYTAAREAADRDPMTGLLNHRAALEALQKALDSAEALPPYTVMMLDINNFKLFNDVYGHPVGDAVICLVARALSELLPSGAIIGRYGGDEFVVGISGLARQEQESLPERLNAELQRQGEGLLFDIRTVPVTISCGAALFPEDGERPSELIAHADRALLDAKTDGEVSRVVRRPSPRLDLYPTEGNTFVLSALDAMVTAVDNKDHYTRTHSEDVAIYSDWLAERLGLSQETRASLRLAALLHDIGKIGIPNSILRKPGWLTVDEYEIMKQHTTLGALIVSGLPGGAELVPVVRSHHERWDGNGYPDALVGEGIPYMARIAAIADAFSAMTTSRPYRRDRDWKAALSEIQSGAGTQFDPILAPLFFEVAQQKLRERAPLPTAA